MYIMCIIVAPGNVDVNPTAASPTSEPAALPPERSDRFIFINSVIHLISSAHACPLCSQWKCDPQSENRAFVTHYRNCQYTYIETEDFWCRFCLSKGAKKGKLAFKQTPPPKKNMRGCISQLQNGNNLFGWNRCQKLKKTFSSWFVFLSLGRSDTLISSTSIQSN